MTDRYAVVGNPIAHSKSPEIHAAFARQTGQDMSYGALLAPLEGFAEYVRHFQRAGGRGLNVTVPFKREAWALADTRTPRAEQAGAANTLSLERDGRVRADNTDGIGLVRDLLHNHGSRIAGQQLLVVGAGGAVRGVLGPLLEEQPRLLVIGNRTADKALRLAREFDRYGRVLGCGLDALAGQRFDLIINGTSASLSGQAPELPARLLAPDGCCYDMMYGPEPTPFMRWGLAEGAEHVVDGLGMLVEQAAESFCIWRGVRPETGPVLEMLRARLGS